MLCLGKNYKSQGGRDGFTRIWRGVSARSVEPALSQPRFPELGWTVGKRLVGQLSLNYCFELGNFFLCACSSRWWHRRTEFPAECRLSPWNHML